MRLAGLLGGLFAAATLLASLFFLGDLKLVVATTPDQSAEYIEIDGSTIRFDGKGSIFYFWRVGAKDGSINIGCKNGYLIEGMIYYTGGPFSSIDFDIIECHPENLRYSKVGGLKRYFRELGWLRADD